MRPSLRSPASYVALDYHYDYDTVARAAAEDRAARFERRLADFTAAARSAAREVLAAVAADVAARVFALELARLEREAEEERQRRQRAFDAAAFEWVVLTLFEAESLYTEGVTAYPAPRVWASTLASGKRPAEPRGRSVAAALGALFSGAPRAARRRAGGAPFRDGRTRGGAAHSETVHGARALAPVWDEPMLLPVPRVGPRLLTLHVLDAAAPDPRRPAPRHGAPRARPARRAVRLPAAPLEPLAPSVTSSGPLEPLAPSVTSSGPCSLRHLIPPSPHLGRRWRWRSTICPSGRRSRAGTSSRPRRPPPRSTRARASSYCSAW